MKKTTKIIISVLLIAFSLLSVFLISPQKNAEKVLSATTERLQSEEEKVIKLAGSTAIASTVIAAVPFDATTPIANEIAGVSTKLLIVYCAIILEKYLLTATWLLFFKYLIPAASAIFIVFLITKKAMILKAAIKITVLGVVITFIVPVSTWIGASIEQNHSKAYEQSVQLLEEYEKTENKNVESEAKAKTAEDGNFYERAGAILKNISISVDNLLKQIKVKADIQKNKIKLSITNLLESVAVMIVTCCVIPILNFVFVLWIIKLLFGIDTAPVYNFVGKSLDAVKDPYTKAEKLIKEIKDDDEG